MLSTFRKYGKLDQYENNQCTRPYGQQMDTFYNKIANATFFMLAKMQNRLKTLPIKIVKTASQR